jgi:hypothetical protein
MTANSTAHARDSERRERMEQIEGILRRLNPELTDEQLKEVIVQFWQRSGCSDG